jgi:transposase
MTTLAATTVTTCDPALLPDDAALLKAMLAEVLAALHSSRHESEQLRIRMDQLLRRLYGRRSERLDANQLLLFDLAPEAAADVTPPADGGDGDGDGSTDSKPRRKGHGRRSLPAHLPRDRRVYELSEAERACGHCGQSRVVIGEETSEQLDYVPASLLVIEHVRLTYACPCCEKKRRADDAITPPAPTPAPDVPLATTSLSDSAATRLVPVSADNDRGVIHLAPTLITAPPPASRRPRGLAGPGLLAHLIVSKFCDHLPLYRCERILARFGVSLARSTLCDWLAQSAVLLRPLWELMRSEVMLSRLLQTDETSVRVQGRAAEEPPGRLWVQCGDAEHPYLVYLYSINKEGQWPQLFLANYRGYLQGDAYAGYDALFASGRITEVGCWAHARRKFYDARTTDPEGAFYALGIIRQLYKVEKEARTQAQQERLTRPEYEALRGRLRQEKSVPLLKTFGEWLDNQAKLLLPKSPLAEAIGYARNQWVALQVYVTAGFLEIDNNAAERALRPVAVGRKNYLFFGSDVGGETAAVLYSMVQTCRHLGVEPWRYLRDVLGRLPGLTADRLGELLPDRWAATQRQAVLDATGPPEESEESDEESGPGPS